MLSPAFSKLRILRIDLYTAYGEIVQFVQSIRLKDAPHEIEFFPNVRGNNTILGTGNRNSQPSHPSCRCVAGDTSTNRANSYFVDGAGAFHE
jgi:hypothetical protein